MAERRENDAADRTHPPTSLRLKEAHRRGQVPRSVELTSAAAVLGCVLALGLLGRGLLSDMTKMTATFLDGRSSGIDGSAGELKDLALRGAGASVARVCGLLVATAGLAALVGLVQVGPMVAGDRVRPDLSRISPRAGLERLLSTRTLVRAAMTLAKVGIVAGVGYWSVRPALPRLASASALDAWGLAGEAAGLVGSMVVRIGLCLLALAGGDWLYQRWQHRRDLRMTRRQWAEDLRTMEGDGRVRRRRREMAGTLHDWRAAREVPSASLVVFDPHRCAVALYRDETAPVPVVVAKGTRWLAMRIRRAAQAAGLPEVADPAVAAEIYRHCRRGEQIPQALLEPVTRMLARRGPAAGDSRGHDG